MTFSTSFKYLLFCMVCAMISCGIVADQNPIKKEAHPGKVVPRKIALAIFNGTDTTMANAMAVALRSEWTPDVDIVRVGDEPAFAFYPPRKRWIADSLLVFLERNNGGRYLKMAGISSRDISTRKGEVENWGVMGLGFCPGGACVVSSFRAKPGTQGFLLRMRSLLFHELGHTFGLPHCPSMGCIMEDAKGKMTFDGEKSFCNACRKRLQDMGLLRIR